MDKPRIFLGSSGKQEKLLKALTRGLEDVAHVEPWTTSLNPGTTTLERLVELAHVLVTSDQRVLATDVSQSVAIGDDGGVEAPIAELHRDHGVPGFVVGDSFS